MEVIKKMYAVEHRYKDGRGTYDIFEELSLAISFSESEKNWSEEHQPLFIFKADFNLDLIYKTDSGWNYDDFSDTILGGYHKIKTYNNAENLNGFVIN